METNTLNTQIEEEFHTLSFSEMYFKQVPYKSQL